MWKTEAALQALAWALWSMQLSLYILRLILCLWGREKKNYPPHCNQTIGSLILDGNGATPPNCYYCSVLPLRPAYAHPHYVCNYSYPPPPPPPSGQPQSPPQFQNNPMITTIGNAGNQRLGMSKVWAIMYNTSKEDKIWDFEASLSKCPTL